MSKFFFCYAISADPGSFCRLIINTKKYSRKKTGTVQRNNEQPVAYHLKPGGHEKTIQLRTFAGDIEMFYEIFLQKVYEHPILKEHEINTIADLGANIGMSSLYFSQLFSTAMIYAVEPDPSNFDILTSNLSEEILQSRLVPVQAAIYSTDGIVNLKQSAKAYNTGIAEEDTGITVRALTFPTFIKEMMITGIDLLKIDIEGGEAYLFNAPEEWLDIVKIIVMECHSPAIRKKSAALLREKGFEILPSIEKAGGAELVWAVRSNND
ncbi:MAG: FkbM family methyltransferase [Sphingobacteriales bacterium]|nr:FkbM family methyltransferase [Sphingobacteriales bacterium]